MYERLPKMTQLLAFDAVARHLNLHEAARALGQPPSSLSRSVRELESLLNTQLLVRGGTGISLTAAGRDFAGYASSAVRIARAGLEHDRALKGEAPERIAIGMTPMIAGTILSGAVARALRNEPGSQIDIVVGGFADCIDRIRRGELDLAAGNALISVPGDFCVRPLMRCPLAVCSSVNNPLRRCRRFEELRRANWVISGSVELLRRMHPDRFAIQPRHAVRARDVNVIMDLAASTEFLSVLPLADIRSHPGRLAAIDLEGFPILTDYVLVYPKDKPRSALAERFIACLMQDAAAFPW